MAMFDFSVIALEAWFQKENRKDAGKKPTDLKLSIHRIATADSGQPERTQTIR